MAETILRSLRDGALDGEYAPALSLSDSLRSPLGPHAFHHFLTSLISTVAANKSQSRGVVLVAFEKSPGFYDSLFKSRGLEPAKWVKILDCYTDPLGWRGEEMGGVFRDVRDGEKLLSAIVDAGRGFVGGGKERFAVAVDSVSDMIRHISLPAVASLINNLRSHDQVSCIFWLLHADLHETRASSAFDYIATMIASLEPIAQLRDGQRTSDNLYWLEQNYHRGKFNVRMKRRNGRVKIINEEFNLEQAGIKFSTVSSESIDVNQSLLPKVQFNLQLSEKELADRSNVILPFEHQGNGEPLQIYDGRTLQDEVTSPFTQPSTLLGEPKQGEIHYIRDSDDEQPDSDEDPDDDLEI